MNLMAFSRLQLIIFTIYYIYSLLFTIITIYYFLPIYNAIRRLSQYPSISDLVNPCGQIVHWSADAV